MPDPDDAQDLIDTTDDDYSADDTADEGAAAMAAEAANEEADETDAEESDSEDGEKESAAGDKEELSDEDKQFLELKGLGVSPEELVKYARKGYAAEHEPAEKPAAKPQEEAADDDDYLPVTKKELRETLKQFAKEAAGSITAANADSTVEALLDTSDYSDDETSRSMVKGRAWNLIKNGVKPRAAFKQAEKAHANWVAKQVAATNQRKVKAKRTAGTRSSGTPVSPLEDLKLEHKEDDFQTGAAHDQAVEFMRKADKLAR